MKMQIGKIAKKGGVTVLTLQYYDSIGLLKPAEVSESGYRYYDENSLESEPINSMKSGTDNTPSLSDLLWEAAEYRTLQQTYTPSNIVDKITFGNDGVFFANMANYDFLRLILEKAVNLPFADILAEYVCKPFGMCDTVFAGHSNAVVYAGGKRVEGEFPNEIVTTAEDSAKFYTVVLDGKLLPLEKYLREIPEGGFGCNRYRCEGVLTHNSDFGGFELETELRHEDGRVWINFRNRPPVPDNGDCVMYYNVKKCGDGYVKLEALETDSGAEFGVYSVSVYDNSTNI